MTALTFRGRLPGVVCQTALPPSGEEAIRLDVAAFVGFAERGPLHTPVAVEDAGQYAALFGGDLQVARKRGPRRKTQERKRRIQSQHKTKTI